MHKKKKILPVFTRLKFVDVAKYVEPAMKHNKIMNGYAVGIGEKNGQKFTFLIPFEEFPKEKITKFIGGELNVKPTESGLRTSLAMQDIEDLREAQELIAVNLQNLENRLNKKFDQVEEWLILLDQDLNKFREVFKVWNSYESQSFQTD